MRTAREIMQKALEEAAEIVKAEFPAASINETVIASSNIAIAIFSYEAETEAMMNAHNMDEDEDDPLNLDEEEENG